MGYIEDAIKGLECCKSNLNRKCSECPYEKDCYHDSVPTLLIFDALKALKENQWISSSTILPPAMEDVLGYREIKYDKIGTVCTYEITHTNEILGKLVWSGDANITHWMPLPPPPKEE